MFKKLVAIVGPTGSGKTALAVALAKACNGVIISADSRQVYRGLDIGTNKEGHSATWPTGSAEAQSARMLDGVPQLLIDIAEPGDKFTLSDWLERAKYALDLIWRHGQVPIIVGGTGLYVTALLEGYVPGEGRFSKKQNSVDFESQTLTLNSSKAELVERSNQRIERIFDDVAEEVRSLLHKKIDPNWLNSVGLDYRFTALYVTGTLGRQEAVEELQKATKDFIRRQITWWRHHGSAQPVGTVDEAVKLTKKFLA